MLWPTSIKPKQLLQVLLYPLLKHFCQKYNLRLTQKTLDKRIQYALMNAFPSLKYNKAGNIKTDKEKSTEKIDGTVATIMGLNRAIRCGNTTGASVYDDRGIIFKL